MEETAAVKVEKSIARQMPYVYCSSNWCFLSTPRCSEKSYSRNEISYKQNVFQVKRFEVVKESELESRFLQMYYIWNLFESSVF